MKWKARDINRKYEDILQESCEAYLNARRIKYVRAKTKPVKCGKCGGVHWVSTAEKGLPDFVAIYLRRAIISIELKRGKTDKNSKGVLRKEQKEFIEALPRGTPMFIIDDFDEFEKLIRKYHD